MDLLRRMFGLQSVSEEEKSPVPAKPVDLEGPTAPLASAKVGMPIDIDLAEPVDLNRTDLLDDDNHSEIHTRRLSEMDIAAYDGRSTRQLIYGIHSDPGQ